MSINPRDSDEEPEDPDTAPLPSFVPPTPPPLIAGYKIIREVARAGHGVVYQAIQMSTNQEVALKTLRNDRSLPKAITEGLEKAFKLEIEVIAQLRHPNIISIHDAGRTVDGRSFYAMEYVNGKPLGGYVGEHKLTMLSMLRHFRTVCEAVGYAHQRGVTHFDLKPSNILVDVQGIVKVLDFGLARPVLMPGEPSITDGGDSFGTLVYMSPEQTRGNRPAMDARSDVYSLSVILYELLTGVFPYPVMPDVTGAETIEHIRETPPLSPATKWTSAFGISGRTPGKCPIDKDINTIVLNALAKEPEQRYRNAGELAQAVGRYINDEPPGPEKWWVGLRRDVRKSVQRRKNAWLGGAIVMAALLSFLLVAPVLNGWPQIDAFFLNLESAFLPAAVKELDLDHVRVIAIKDDTPVEDLTRDAGVEGVTTENRTSLRRLHGRLMEQLAESGCSTLVWDIGFPGETDFDEDFVAGVRRLGEVGIDVVVTVDKWWLGEDDQPDLSATIAPAVRPGCSAANVWELPWWVQLVVQRGWADPLPSLSLAAFAAAQHPRYYYDVRFEPEGAFVILAYGKSDGKNPKGQNYPPKPDRIQLTFTQPWEGTTGPLDFSLLNGDMLGVMTVAIPSDEKLAAATVPYQTAFRAKPEELQRQFAGKVVIVSNQRSDSGDWHRHPDGRLIPGCYIHAAAIEALFRKSFIQTVKEGEGFASAWIGALLGCAAAYWMAGSVLRRYLVLAGLMIVLVALTLFACWWFQYLLHPPLIPIVALWMGCEASALVLRIWQARRE